MPKSIFAQLFERNRASRPAASRSQTTHVLTNAIPRQPVQTEPKPKPDPATERRRIATQDRQNAEVMKLVAELGRAHQAEAARAAAANTPEARARSVAQNVLQVSAELRGETFSRKGWIDAPPQTQHKPSATDVSKSIAAYQARCREQARLRGEPEPKFGY